MIAKFSFGDVFPHDSDLSVWIATVAMMSNDVVVATSALKQVLNDDGPTKPGERLYWFRLTSSHYREAIKYLTHTKSKQCVQQFIQKLSVNAQNAYRLMLDNASNPKADTVFSTRIVATRNVTFHYPHRQCVRRALEQLNDRQGYVALNGRSMMSFRALFADEILLQLMGSNSEYERKEISQLSEWTGALIKFCNHAISTYLADFRDCIEIE